MWIFRNRRNAAANNNTSEEADFPGYTGAVLAIWKGFAEWGSEPHGEGRGKKTGCIGQIEVLEPCLAQPRQPAEICDSSFRLPLHRIIAREKASMASPCRPRSEVATCMTRSVTPASS